MVQYTTHNLRQLQGQTPLMLASAGGHLHAVALLILAGADLALTDTKVR